MYEYGLRDPYREEWFEFYNVRVVQPSPFACFFLMPTIADGGFEVIEAGTGDGGRLDVHHYDGPFSWHGEESRCHMTWSSEQSSGVLSDTEVKYKSNAAMWDLRVRPAVPGVRSEQSARQVARQERVILRAAPFIHLVPHMKGLASGTIRHAGQEYAIDDAPLYLGKNHGRAFPDMWQWVHAHVFDDPCLAFEIGSLVAGKKSLGIARFHDAHGITTVTSLTGASIGMRSVDGRCDFQCECDEAKVGGQAWMKEPVTFECAGPLNTSLRITEGFSGSMGMSWNGRVHRAKCVAVGTAHRL